MNAFTRKQKNQHGLSNKCVKKNSLRLYITLHLPDFTRQQTKLQHHKVAAQTMR